MLNEIIYKNFRSDVDELIRQYEQNSNNANTIASSNENNNDEGKRIRKTTALMEKQESLAFLTGRETKNKKLRKLRNITSKSFRERQLPSVSTYASNYSIFPKPPKLTRSIFKVEDLDLSKTVDTDQTNTTTQKDSPSEHFKSLSESEKVKAPDVKIKSEPTAMELAFKQFEKKSSIEPKPKPKSAFGASIESLDIDNGFPRQLSDVVFESEGSDLSFSPSPILGYTRRLSNPFMNLRKTNDSEEGNAESGETFFKKNDAFNTHILSIAKMNRLKSKADSKRVQVSEREANLNIIKKVNVLRYRENVFRAAARLSPSMPPFPKYSYKDKPEFQLDIITFNIGGTKFDTFDDTIMNLQGTKLADCFADHDSGPILFFDRNPTCFSAVLNFYRTGRLHAPINTCLSFFEEELEFWGIHEDLMEPCCYSDYKANKIASNNLKRYMENKDSPISSKNDQTGGNKIHQKLYNISILQDNGVLGRWYSSVCAAAIILSIVTMVFGTSVSGRVDVSDISIDTELHTNETNLQFFARTQIRPTLQMIDILLVGFFLADIITRFLLSPNRMIFFADTINWVDFMAMFSSLLSDLPIVSRHSGEYEVYILLLKVPRVLRLFRLTNNLRSGMDAMMMTLGSSLHELVLVLILTIIATCSFGVLIFVEELVNEIPIGQPSHFESIGAGMWWAIVTMGTVGYGDLTPKSSGGYIIGFCCILTGIIITQLPVPIFLKNFSIYYNQIRARLQQLNKELTANVDPENLLETTDLISKPSCKMSEQEARHSRPSLKQEHLIKMKSFQNAKNTDKEEPV